MCVCVCVRGEGEGEGRFLSCAFELKSTYNVRTLYACHVLYMCTAPQGDWGTNICYFCRLVQKCKILYPLTLAMCTIIEHWNLSTLYHLRVQIAK